MDLDACYCQQPTGVGYDSNSGDNNIELRFNYSESADENTEPAATEPLLSDDSVCEVLDELSSLFGQREESDLGEDDEFDSDNDQESSKDESNDEDDNIELRLSDAESADDNTEPTATELVMSDDSVHELLDGLSSLFDEHGESDLGDDHDKESEYGDFPDDEESTVDVLGESTPKDKQEPIVQSTDCRLQTRGLTTKECIRQGNIVDILPTITA